MKSARPVLKLDFIARVRSSSSCAVRSPSSSIVSNVSLTHHFLCCTVKANTMLDSGKDLQSVAIKQSIYYHQQGFELGPHDTPIHVESLQLVALQLVWTEHRY